ncbi:hypothetical protein AtNW77_Chr5g0083601 [Arabidopsis thaliana]|uniref:DUF674 family protein n=1 Tax=Arabidopsis thaliana x Arabidopsis arenosa TaxID=1240361 RepID=A0A8T2CMP9_9BRAS|nr:hypothetical protein ISN45_At05g000150 [Arabidopsis thaliana x Arabidopsis arenosa]
MAESSEEPKVSLRLFIDEEKNKVVLAEASKAFVDVLFSLLTLPMGTIIRLLGEHRESQPITVGCFSNLYRSVADMGIDNFKTDVCKHILLHPRSVRDVQYKRLKLNINPTEVKLFTCPDLCKFYSHFSTSRCQCGSSMNKEFQEPKVVPVASSIQNDVNGVFIITDDLKVAVRSTDVVLNELKSLGSGDISKLREMLVYIGFEEVLTLLECMFSSKAPLTNTFLNKQTFQGQGVTKVYETFSPCMETNGDTFLTLDVIVRKQDMEILYVECGEDFVDLLFTFLAVPLEYVVGISGNSCSFVCIRNLIRSFKDLNAAEVSTSKSAIHHFYRGQKQLLNIITDQPPLYRRYRDYCGQFRYILTEFSGSTPLILIDPEGSGFVKRETKFTVSDDLIVTAMNSSSTICLLQKFQIHGDDLEVKKISISKTEATSLLRASLVTSSALKTSLRNLILKNPKEEI